MKTREEKKWGIYNSDFSLVDEDEARAWLVECGNEDPSQDEVYDQMEHWVECDWENVSSHLKNCFSSGKFLLVGEAGRWNGTFACGKVLDGFDEVEKAWCCNDYMDVEIYDVCKGGHYEFHVKGHHQDGTDHWIIKELTNRGVEYFEKWESNWDDKRTEEEIHQILWNNSHYTKNVEFTKRYYR